MRLLSKVFRGIFFVSLLLLVFAWWKKDQVPAADFYDIAQLPEPRQVKTKQAPFVTTVNNQQYQIMPEFEYELNGVVVSYHDADALGDIWHHDKWKDFINVRDLCVIWGENVSNGVYQDMDFKNDSWTCWAYWPDRETGALFSMSQISNNHLLTDDEELKKILMSVEPGDHIRLSGLLASYANPGNGFRRGTSTKRTDTGNGACETIYLRHIEVVGKANVGMRRLFSISKWTSILSLLALAVLFFYTPVTRYHAGDSR